GSASSSCSSIFDDSPYSELADSEEVHSAAFDMKHSKGSGKEPSAEQQDEEVRSDGELESESRGIFLDPSQVSILPDILPGESDASQLAPGNNKEKKKRPVLQLTDMDAADDGDETG